MGTCKEVEVLCVEWPYRTLNPTTLQFRLCSLKFADTSGNRTVSTDCQLCPWQLYSSPPEDLLRSFLTMLLGLWSLANSPSVGRLPRL